MRDVMKELPRYRHVKTTPPKKVYHGTAKALGYRVEKEGLNPEGNIPKEFLKVFSKEELQTFSGKSPQSEKGYVYFFSDLERARNFGCGSSWKTGFPKAVAETFAINTSAVKVENDPLLLDSWRHRGIIPADKLEIVDKAFDCETAGWGKNYWKQFARLF
jgi:hypothetical protein